MSWMCTFNGAIELLWSDCMVGVERFRETRETYSCRWAVHCINHRITNFFGLKFPILFHYMTVNTGKNVLCSSANVDDSKIKSKSNSRPNAEALCPTWPSDSKGWRKIDFCCIQVEKQNPCTPFFFLARMRSSPTFLVRKTWCQDGDSSVSWRLSSS